MGSPVPSDNLYITDLPVGIDDNGVRDILAAYGTITSVKVLASRIEGSKGAALVRFSNPQQAKWIVENLNGNMPEGLTEPIKCAFAQERGDKGGKGKEKGGGFEKGGYAPYAAPAPVYQPPAAPAGAGGDNLFIGDLPESITEDWMRQLFGSYGNIAAVKILPPKAPGQKGASLLRLGSPAEAKWIVDNLNGNMPEGLSEPIVAKYAHSDNKGKGYGKADAGKGGYDSGKGYAPYDSGKGYDGYDAGKGYASKGGKDGGGKGGTIKGLLDSAIKGGTLPNGDGSGKRPEENCVYVRGLPTDTTDVDLYKLFGCFGAIAPRGCKAMMHPDGFTCTSVGFVDYLHPETAQDAIAALNGFVLADNTTLFLKTKDPKGSGKGKKDDGKGKGY